MVLLNRTALRIFVQPTNNVSMMKQASAQRSQPNGKLRNETSLGNFATKLRNGGNFALHSQQLILSSASAMEPQLPSPSRPIGIKDKIRNQLRKDVDHFLEVAKPAADCQHLNYTRAEWHALIDEAVASLRNSPTDITMDCWFSNRPHDKSGYPMIYPKRIDRDGKQRTDKSAVKMCRIFGMLKFPEHLAVLQTQDRQLQAAHRCHHESALCWNPHHIIFTSDGDNKDMSGCHYGMHTLCPHRPVCIWTDESGILIPCRNIEADCGCELQNCYQVHGNQEKSKATTLAAEKRVVRQDVSESIDL